MQAFEYTTATSVAEAVQSLAAKPGSVALAGGTDLLDRMKDYVTTPTRVVYIKRLTELTKNAVGGGALIGAGVTLARLSTTFNSVQQAAKEVGSPQIRNMATVGGNLLQRPRCWYYRNGFGLLGKKEGIEGNAVRAGDNRYGPIFLTDGDALFVNTSSLAPPLIALGAKATLVGPKGERTIDVAELYRVPKNPDELELTIDPAEVLTHVSIPLAERGLKDASYEVRLKQSHDWPLVLCSVKLELDGDTVKTAKVVLGSVAPIPYVSEAAAKAITGKAVTPETAEAAGKAAVAEAKPLSKNAYKVKLTEVAIKRALLSAVGNRYWEA
jgi:xanthine dehydrogenase YagS FAD-binding subunit